MLRRFAAACAVAFVVIAVGAVISLLPPRWPAADARILTTAWCFVPLAWGLWAMLAPARWGSQPMANMGCDPGWSRGHHSWSCARSPVPHGWAERCPLDAARRGTDLLLLSVAACQCRLSFPACYGSASRCSQHIGPDSERSLAGVSQPHEVRTNHLVGMRWLAVILEAVTGIMYPAVLIGRLIGLHISRRDLVP